MPQQSKYTDDLREVKAGGNAGWSLGQMAGELHRDDRVPFHVLEFSATINAAAPGALSDAAIKQFLGGITLDFTHNVDNGNKPRNPHSKLPLSKLKLLGYNQLEREVKYLTDAAVGLKKVLAEGDNTVIFHMLQPLGKVENIRELRITGGMGSEQLLGATLYIKAESNPLPVGYTFKGLTVRLVPYTERDNGAFVGMVPEYVADRTIPGKVLELDAGLTLSVWDTQKPLSESTYPEVEVKVGNVLVAPEQPPARIFADYADQPNAGVAELRVADDVTPLYLVPDTELTNVPTGKVRIEKKTDTGGWAVDFAYFPIDETSDALVNQQLRSIARRRNRGVDCLAVNKVALAKRGIDKSQHIAVQGFVVFDSENDPRQMKLTPGLLIPGGIPNAKPVVHIPPSWLNSYAPRWAAAWRANDRDTSGSLERELCAYIPGCQTSDRGLGDTENWVRTEVRAALARAAGVDLNAA
jgi:hypothetical protein